MMWTLGATYLSTVEEISRPLLKCNPFQGMSIQESKDSSKLSLPVLHTGWRQASSTLAVLQLSSLPVLMGACDVPMDMASTACQRAAFAAEHIK